MPSHAAKMRRARRHLKHKQHKRGANRHHRRNANHKKLHSKSKHGHKHKAKAHKSRSGGHRASRRMDHYHMRRRYLHAGIVGGALGAGVSVDHDDDENSIIDEEYLHDVLEEGSEDEDDQNLSVSEDADQPEEPPNLESDDHYHVFIFHSNNVDDQEQVEHYVHIIESSPHDLKVMTNERDFKHELSFLDNIKLALSLSLRTVIFCTKDFISNHLQQFDSVVTKVYNQEQLRSKVQVVLAEGVRLPECLQKFTKIYHLDDLDCFEHLTRQLMSNLVMNEGKPSTATGKPSNEVVPTAPEAPNEAEGEKGDKKPPTVELPTIYPNGHVVKKVTARSYSDLTQADKELGLCLTYCPQADIFFPKSDPRYRVPECLTKRGLEVSETEFAQIITSLTEASKVTFFQKAVDCSIPCLYLASFLIVSCISCLLWFLVVGALHHYKPAEEISGSIFWSFMLFIVFVPALTALALLGIVLHLVNYKFLKYRIYIEEFNKKYRDAHLVLHAKKGYWFCSGKLKLYFIYYDFEDCQQFLYCYVHDNMKLKDGSQTPESEKLLNNNSTVKLDRIMKRVNTLTKKYEWDYFEALTTQSLPPVYEKEHRKKGMCFCQYVLHRDQQGAPLTMVPHVKEQVDSITKNALKKSHNRQTPRTSTSTYSTTILATKNDEHV